MHVFSHHIYNDLSFVCWENSRCARFKNPSCGRWCKTIRIHLNVCRLDKWGPVLKVLKVEQTAGECRTHGNYRTGSVDVCHLGQSVKTRFGSNKLLTMRTRRRRRKKRRRGGDGYTVSFTAKKILAHNHLHSEGEKWSMETIRGFFLKVQ